MKLTFRQVTVLAFFLLSAAVLRAEEQQSREHFREMEGQEGVKVLSQFLGKNINPYCEHIKNKKKQAQCSFELSEESFKVTPEITKRNCGQLVEPALQVCILEAIDTIHATRKDFLLECKNPKSPEKEALCTVKKANARWLKMR